MKKAVIILFLFLFPAFVFAQQTPPDDDLPDQKEQYKEKEKEKIFEESIPAKEPQKLEQKEPAFPDSGNIKPQKQLNLESEQIEDNFKHAKPIKQNELPDAIINDLKEGYFSDWKIAEVYKAKQTEAIPAEYIIKVEKDLIFMYLFYTKEGQLVIQKREKK